jgi:hypothetical protein
MLVRNTPGFDLTNGSLIRILSLPDQGPSWTCAQAETRSRTRTYSEI